MKYLTAPEIRTGSCCGCANVGPDRKSCLISCATFRAQHDLPDCVSHHIVFVRNTPEGRAAYIARKLEAANG